MNVNSKAIFVDSLKVSLLLTCISLIIAEYAGWLGGMSNINPLELVAVIASFACTYMCVMQSRWNYPMAVLSTSLLAIVFYQSDLLASAVLNIYLIPTVIYGWFIWGRDEDTKPVSHVRLTILPQYVLFTVLAYVGAALIANALGGALAPLDSWLLIGSILAQFLMDRKKIEAWLVWIAVNIVSIYVYFESGLYLLAIQFFFFLINSVYGYYMWRSTQLKQEVPI
jgi:nicotinamide mononucleotide transporter